MDGSIVAYANIMGVSVTLDERLKDKNMRNVELEVQIGIESCCGVTLNDMEKTFQVLCEHPDYTPPFIRDKLLSPEFQESRVFQAVKDIFFFSAMVALRKANGMPVPEEFFDNEEELLCS